MEENNARNKAKYTLADPVSKLGFHRLFQKAVKNHITGKLGVDRVGRAACLAVPSFPNLATTESA